MYVVRLADVLYSYFVLIMEHRRVLIELVRPKTKQASMHWCSGIDHGINS